MKKSLKAAMSCAATIGAASPATAAVVYQFELTGAALASFQLSSEPDPAGIRNGDLGYDSFYIQNISVSYNGVDGLAELEFFSEADWFGGFGLNVGGGQPEVSTVGAYLFTGPSSNPIFKTGTFNLVGYFNSNQLYSLTISELSAAVPEPATWAMVIGGFGLVGGAMRRRTSKLAVTYA